MATPPTFVDADGDGDDMNASLWGELQRFVDLSMIYAKLPLAPFFRLRQVCKEWNRLASDRQFLEQNFKPPISSNPYFVLTRPSSRHVLLTCEGSSWSSTPVPRARCEVSGLLFEDSDRNRVFDLHTRVFHTLPPLPAVVQAPALPVEEEDDYEDPLTLMSVEEEDDYEDPLTLMTVDTTLIPYGFRVVIADEVIGTRIYDSNTGAWTLKRSMSEFWAPVFGTSCVRYKKSLYIRTGDSLTDGFNVESYNLERDQWDSQVLEIPEDLWECSDVGVWQDRWFVFGVNTGSDVVVWECPSNFWEPWAQFDYMPNDLRKWMKDSACHMILNKFFGEHVLVYNRFEDEIKAVLYNLDRKTWDKIELPATPISQ